VTEPRPAALSRQDPIAMVAYDPAWPALFERERRRVARALGPWLVGPVEHIGSTAIPGLAAKPIIDMLARIADYEAGDRIVAAMAAIGWTHAPEPHDRRTRTWELCFPNVSRRTHHLHVVEHRSAAWPTWLAFRDHLRDHPADAAEYARVKQVLAAVHRHDRPAYRAGKAPFIEDLVRRMASTPS
jgi:GrpB-like predicted nucleotidyltransferase (UPF0157 family)